MSMAWEVTTEDVETVMRSHGLSPTDAEVTAAHDALDFDRIERDVLYETDFDAQVAAMNESIAEGLKENGIL